MRRNSCAICKHLLTRQLLAFSARSDSGAEWEYFHGEHGEHGVKKKVVVSGPVVPVSPVENSSLGS